MKKLLSILLILFILIPLSGCASTEEELSEADVSDETVFTPPEEDGTLAGIWSAEGEELKINRYFYGDGKLVTIIQNPEDETWCILSLWEEEDKKITVENKELYTYDSATSAWKEGDPNSQVVSKAEQTGDDSFTADETMPNEINASFSYKRGSIDIEIPDEVSIVEKINAFLIH